MIVSCAFISVLRFCDAAQISLCKCAQKKEMPNSFKSVFGHSREELKQKIRVTDVLLGELLKRSILIQQNIDDINVSV